MSHHLLTCQQRGISWNGSAGTGSGSCAWSDSSHSSRTSCSWCSAGCCVGKTPDTNRHVYIYTMWNQGTKKNQHTYEIFQFFHISFWLLPYLASLACMHSIVETRCNVATDFAKQDHSTCLWGRKVNCEISCKNTHTHVYEGINIYAYRQLGKLTGESSRESAWPFPRNGVCIGMLWSSCWCWGATIDLWELEHQFGGWSVAPSCPLFQCPDLREGNLLWRWRLGVWRRWLCLVSTGRAAGAGTGTARGASIQDYSSWRERMEMFT